MMSQNCRLNRRVLVEWINQSKKVLPLSPFLSLEIKNMLSFPHYLAVDSTAHFFLSGIPSRSNLLLHFKVRIVQSAFLVLVNRVRSSE